ncbi:MAG: family transporter protein, partial [Mucilaginibacter sp.]|nr:family transporter protein [Mucilaginibacter sp.]
VKAFVTIVNKTNTPITKLLLDGDELTDYSIKIKGKGVPFIYPLMYTRGILNFMRPKQDTADFRLYQFQHPLAPGDSAVLEINSSIAHKGFSNGVYAPTLLRNGTFFTGGLPGLGYDDDDEVSSPYERKEHHLPPKKDEDIPQNDPNGIRTLKSGRTSDLLSLDITVSTSADQIAVAPGELQKQWQQNGRNYYHYIQNSPGMYAPLGILSAKYAVLHDSVRLNKGHKVNINIYYHPTHNANTFRFMAAYKDGLRYFSSAFGEYPFAAIRLAETSVYGPWEASLTTLDTYNERYAWNADFTNPNQNDYCYFETAQALAQQWWRYQVAPNSTVGSLVIPEGLARYSALVMTEKKYGKNNMKGILQEQLWPYLIIRHRLEEKEHPLIKANKWFEWSGKAGVVLYGLRDLIGEDSLNSALRDFKNNYAFSNKPPFAWANDLYRILQKHVPDSLQYYLTDSWQKITLYDNKVTDVKAVSTGKNKAYKVTLKVNVAKVYIDDKGNDVPAKNMNDYIAIGVFAAESKNKEGRSQTNPLYLQKYKLTAGQHTITIAVKGKPAYAAIDPYNILIDRIPNDNLKDF